MSIFDNMSPDQIAELLSMDNGGLDLTMAGQTRQNPSIWDMPNLPTIMDEKPPLVPPTPPSSFKPGDVSGFANYGMKPPQLPVGQGMLSMPGVQDASRPAQPGSPIVNPGLQSPPSMPRPGLANMPNPSMQQSLPNPMQQIGNIMSMIGNPNKENKQSSAGGLMSYLKSLGV